MDAYALADLAYQVERLDLKIDGGYQDQYAATFEDSTLLSSTDATMWWLILCALKKDIIHELQYNLLLCYTGKSMSLPILSRTRCKTMRKRTPLRPCVR